MNTQYELEVEAEALLRKYFPDEVIDIMVTMNPYNKIDVIERIVREATHERQP